MCFFYHFENIRVSHAPTLLLAFDSLLQETNGPGLRT